MEKQKTSHKVAQELLQRDSPRAQRRHATRLWQLTRRAAKPSRLPLMMKSFSWFPAARPHGQPAPSDALGAPPRVESSGAGSDVEVGPRDGLCAARWVGGCRAGPRDRPGAARTGEGWWGRGGRLASGLSIAPPTQRQGRAIRGRAAHRARTRARGAAKCGQFAGTSNEPFFAAIGARGAAPRRLQCARDHA